MSFFTLGIMRLPHGEGIGLPSYETAQSAGMDIRAACDEGKPIVLAPGKRALVPSGLIFEIPEGFEAQIRPRSGLALKHGIGCLNSPGTIDADYRGEVGILLINHGDKNFEITRGMRIAQVVLAPVQQIRVTEVDDVNTTSRGTGGFGSTGV